MHLRESSHLLLNCPANYEVRTTAVLLCDRDTKSQKSNLLGFAKNSPGSTDPVPNLRMGGG